MLTTPACHDNLIFLKHSILRVLFFFADFDITYYFLIFPTVLLFFVNVILLTSLRLCIGVSMLLSSVCHDCSCFSQCGCHRNPPSIMNVLTELITMAGLNISFGNVTKWIDDDFFSTFHRRHCNDIVYICCGWLYRPGKSLTTKKISLPGSHNHHSTAKSLLVLFSFSMNYFLFLIWYVLSAMTKTFTYALISGLYFQTYIICLSNMLCYNY